MQASTMTKSFQDGKNISRTVIEYEIEYVHVCVWLWGGGGPS